MPTRTLALLVLAGCLGPKPLDSGDGDDSGTGGAGGTSAYDVNDGTVAVGEVVSLEGLVVTSPPTRDGEGFFVADPDGGAGSGLYVWGPSAMAALTTVPAVGDEVKITGEVQDYYGWIELTIGSADDVEVTGTATVPAPVDLGTGEGVDWSQYESVLVTLADQDILEIDQYNTATLSCGVNLDDGFVYLDFGCGGHYDSVTGIVFYSYEEWSVNPRTEDDLGAFTGSGTSGASTVADVQAGETCGDVELSGLVVTSPVVEKDGDSTFFAQDAGGGEWAGIAIFVPGTVVDVQVGDVIDVNGSVSEYYGFTEVFVDDAASLVVTGSGETPVATTLTAAPSDWEPYEGVLVSLEGVTVTGDVTDYGQWPTDFGIQIDDLFGEVTAANGDVFATATGLVYYSFEEWNLEPRTADDLVRD